MRIIVLASDNPSPPINGTRIRNYHLWKEVRKLGHEVKVLALTRNIADLKKNSEEIEFFSFTRKNIFIRLWKRLFYSYHEWPISNTLDARVKNLVKQWHPDVIHSEELRMGHYLPKKNESSRALLSLCVHNVESNLISQTLAAPFPFAVKFFNRIYRLNLIRFEKRVFKVPDILMTYSEIDKITYQNLYPRHHFKSSSNGVNLMEFTSDELQLPPAKNILFLGSLSYLPNIEGLFWLLDEVLPKLKEEIQLTVAGSRPAFIVREKLNQLNIKLLDTPLDLKPVYLENSLLLVPLLSGSGTRGKILESLMYGRPILTTTKGIEGLDLKTKEGVFIADGPVEFAKAIDQWINSESNERQEIAECGRSAVVSKYTWNRVGHEMIKSWMKIMAELPRQSKNL